MKIENNILKDYLKNVYFITGTPCGGKTTVSRLLGKKYGIKVYDIDEEFENHQRIADEKHQPNMTKDFKDADEFFGRSVEEYRNWLVNNTREQLDFVILDLIRLSQNEKVICDCHLTMKQAKELSDPSRVAFLIRKPVEVVDEYCNRPDHQGFNDFIHSASDFEEAKRVCNETLLSLNMDNYEAIKRSKYFWLERDVSRNPERASELVARHLGLEPSENIEIKKVEKDTKLQEELLEFVKNCSWVETKDHIASNIEKWVFEDWETIFAAVAGGKVVGMTSIMKTDYYPVTDIYPWVSCVFVTEDYRGQRLSAKLIAKANEYAKDLGFERTYIPSEHNGLYERYGYTYLRDIVNYGGDVDRLYVKEL